MSRHWRFPLFLAGLALVGASIACGGAAATQAPQAEAPLSTPAATSPGMLIDLTPVVEMPTALASPAATQPASPAIPERRRVTLEYPPRIRAGDSGIVQLILEVDTLGAITPTAVVSGNTVTGETVEIPNLYETHNVIAEARLDLAGVDVRPPETISSPLLPGEKVTFYWSVKPESSGKFKGTAWLRLRFVDKVTGQESQRAISAQTVEIQSTDLLGLPAGIVRATGGIGSVVGGIIGFPFFDDVLKALYRKLRKR